MQLLVDTCSHFSSSFAAPGRSYLPFGGLFAFWLETVSIYYFIKLKKCMYIYVNFKKSQWVCTVKERFRLGTPSTSITSRISAKSVKFQNYIWSPRTFCAPGILPGFRRCSGRGRGGLGGEGGREGGVGRGRNRRTWECNWMHASRKLLFDCDDFEVLEFENDMHTLGEVRLFQKENR